MYLHNNLFIIRPGISAMSLIYNLFVMDVMELTCTIIQ